MDQYDSEWDTITFRTCTQSRVSIIFFEINFSLKNLHDARVIDRSIYVDFIHWNNQETFRNRLMVINYQKHEATFSI